jgi:hypothetical protein
LLLFVPWRTWVFRLIVIGSFIAFHIGLMVCLELGNFEQVCIVGWLALLPTEFWDWVMSWFKPADSRPQGQSTIPPPPPALSVVLALVIVYVIVFNVSTWHEPHSESNSVVWEGVLTARDAVRDRFPLRNAAPGLIFGLDQGWGYFGPEPTRVHGWLTAIGTLADGRQVDLMSFALHGRAAPPTWDRPEMISETYPNWRWRSYMMRLGMLAPADHPYRHYFALYLRDRWDAVHPDAKDRLRFVDLYVMRERTATDGPPPPVERVRLCRLDCETGTSDLNETTDDHGGKADQIVP